MNDRLIKLFFLLFTLSAYYLEAFLVDDSCNCSSYTSYHIRSQSYVFRNWFLFSTSDDGLPKDENHKYYNYFVISKKLEGCKVRNPETYFQFRNNMLVCNTSLLVGNDYHDKYAMEFNDLKKTDCTKTYTKESIEYNFDIDSEIRRRFCMAYKSCIKYGHNSMSTLFDMGFIRFVEGDVEHAAQNFNKYIEFCNSYDLNNDIHSEHWFAIAEADLELKQYSNAIERLSKALKIDSTNSNAYQNRAYAYFETGDFEKALEDYLSSRNLDIRQNIQKPSPTFTDALLSNILLSALDSAAEFIPSLCDSAYGIGTALWITAQHPVESIQDFSQSCHELGFAVCEFCKNLNWERLEGYSDNIKAVCENYNQLTDEERGKHIGQVIGKFGVDAFSGLIAVKGISALRNFKKANGLCNLEAMSLSVSNNAEITKKALEHAAKRDSYFSSVKYNFGDHRKHMEGHSHYVPSASIFQHPDPEGLLKNFAGTGRGVKGDPSFSGYKEIVNFKEHIGIYKNQNTIIGLPTTKGTIHYGKKGAHIVPAHPES